MDLKDVVAKVEIEATEAVNAYNAGHHDRAENHLAKIGVMVGGYQPRFEASKADVTESATIEKPKEDAHETPAQVPGDSAQPATPGAAAAAGKVLPASQFEKPSQ